MVRKTLQAVDFFCGAGGVTCGFKNAGIKVLGGIDIDPMCKETYERNNQAKYLNFDVSNVRVSKLQELLPIEKNQENLIFVGCSPCQYYSNIKSDKSKSISTRYLLEDFQKFIAFYKPGHVFIENVPGIETKDGSPLKRFKRFIHKSGYYFDDGRVNAKTFGVPQNRLRYVLVASRIKKGISINDMGSEPPSTVREAIGNYSIIPKIKVGQIDTSNLQHTTANISELNMKRLVATPKNGGDKRDWPIDLQLPSSKRHSGHYDVYGRMFWDKPSPTITTKFRSLSNGRFGHPQQNRAISLREGAILQSFPLDYIFHSTSQVAVARMIGNAVPPVLAQKIGELFK